MPIPFLSCVHTHTNFCDGKDAPEVLVKRALELGFVSLGFSSHGPTSWDEFAMKADAVPRYQAELKCLRQIYGDRIEILLGVEHEAIRKLVEAGQIDDEVARQLREEIYLFQMQLSE